MDQLDATCEELEEIREQYEELTDKLEIKLLATIEVTNKMYEAALPILLAYDKKFDSEYRIIEDIYRAMEAVKPTKAQIPKE